MTNAIRLKPGRDSALLRRHPWIFSGAIAKIIGQPTAGETILIESAKGDALALAAYSPQSQITARVWSFDIATSIDTAFFLQRVQQAQALRVQLLSPQITAYRVVNAESDGLPGIVVDRYADCLVLQCLTQGAQYQRDHLLSALIDVFSPLGIKTIYERSDVEIRRKEGLELTKGLLWGVEPSETIQIQEGPVQFLIDVKNGHKTGFYLDQRDNRAIVAAYSKHKTVLNCFAYTGGFGIAALQNDAAHVTHLESSAHMTDVITQQANINQLDLSRMQCVTGDAFQVLRQYRSENKTFDVIVLDPPKFAESNAQLKGACRGYKDINWVAMQLLNPGGTLFTFSCSGLMPQDLFEKIVADAALDAKRQARVVKRLFAGMDHPFATAFPEGSYLKGMMVHVD